MEVQDYRKSFGIGASKRFVPSHEYEQGNNEYSGRMLQRFHALLNLLISFIFNSGNDKVLNGDQGAVGRIAQR